MIFFLESQFAVGIVHWVVQCTCHGSGTSFFLALAEGIWKQLILLYGHLLRFFKSPYKNLSVFQPGSFNHLVRNNVRLTG